jgi:hypothetical protein
MQLKDAAFSYLAEDKAARMACRKTARRAGTKKRAQRATSNVFAMFDQDQISEFKEAFNMIDQVSLPRTFFSSPPTTSWQNRLILAPGSQVLYLRMR